MASTKEKNNTNIHGGLNVNLNDNQTLKRKVDDSSDIEDNTEATPSKMINSSTDAWPRFIVLTSKDSEKPLSKVSPFVIDKIIKSNAGEVKNVSKLRSGSLLVECVRRQQSVNLLSLEKVMDIQIESSPHKTLNYSQGIIRDRDLAEISEEEICEELKPQGITKVKRFKKLVNGNLVNLNTFLLTFESPSIPKSIFVGPYSIKVNPYIPNPTRCFNCQKFGHGKNSCKGTERCVRCAEEGHCNFSCDKDVKCVNCGQQHMSSSKNCPAYKREKEIQKLKTEGNMSYQEARKLISVTKDSVLSYASVAKAKPSSTNVETQTIYTWPLGEDLPFAKHFEFPFKEKVIIVSQSKSSCSQASQSNISVSDVELAPAVSFSMSTRRVLQDQFAKPTVFSAPKGKASSPPQTSSDKQSPRTSSVGKKQNNQNKEKSKPALNQEKKYQSDRKSKLEKDAIAMHNRFNSLDRDPDNLESEDSMEFENAPPPRAVSKSPHRGRKTDKKENISPIRPPNE